jgi:hypothetical protein
MIYIYALSSFFADAILAGFNAGAEPEYLFFYFVRTTFFPGIIVIIYEIHCSA